MTSRVVPAVLTEDPSALEKMAQQAETFTDYVSMLGDTYKRSDPNHPTWLSPYSTFDMQPDHAWNLADLMGAADVVNTHGQPLPVQAAHNFMGPHYHDKLWADAEYVNNGPEGCVPNPSEAAAR